MCSVYGVQFSGHDQQHSARTGPGPAYLRLCPVVKCGIRRVKGWRVTGGGHLQNQTMMKTRGLSRCWLRVCGQCWGCTIQCNFPEQPFSTEVAQSSATLTESVISCCNLLTLLTGQEWSCHGQYLVLCSSVQSWPHRHDTQCLHRPQLSFHELRSGDNITDITLPRTQDDSLSFYKAEDVRSEATLFQ